MEKLISRTIKVRNWDCVKVIESYGGYTTEIVRVKTYDDPKEPKGYYKCTLVSAEDIKFTLPVWQFVAATEHGVIETKKGE